MKNATLFDRDALMDAIRSGFKPEYLYFWGHTAKHEATIGKACLSQWYPANFTVDGHTYPTAEHFMMAGKALAFGDQETFGRVLNAASPNAAKRLGREVRGFDEAHWQQVRCDLVVQGNLEKFRQNPALRDYLLGTDECVIVEASPVDRIWGIGLSADDPRATNPEQWDGLNLLGFALMAVRTILAHRR